MRFRVSRKGEPFEAMTLNLCEFIRRLLEHVPPVGYRVVRACGLYHHHYREQLEACRRQLGGGSLADCDRPQDDGDNRTEAARARELTLELCPVCGALLEIELIPRAPPPLEIAKYLGPIRLLSDNYTCAPCCLTARCYPKIGVVGQSDERAPAKPRWLACGEVRPVA